MTKLLITALVLGVLTSPAYAGEVEPVVRYHNLGTLLSGAALNGSASSLTFTVGPAVGSSTLLAYSTLVLRVAYTHATNGTLTLTCTEGATAATATASLTTGTVSSGTYTLAWGGVIVTPTLAASKTFKAELGVYGSQALSCVVAHSGAATANDTVTITGFLLGSGV